MTRPAKEKHCGQCGQSYTARACGPTHAMISNERKAGHPAKASKVRPVRAWAVVSSGGSIVQLLMTMNRQSREWVLSFRGYRVVRVLITPIEAPK